MLKLKIFLSLVVLAGALDFVWLGLIGSSFYVDNLRPILRLKEDGTLAPVLWAAALVYLLIPFGIVGRPALF